MCGIFVVLLAQGADASQMRQVALRQTRLIRHRGPDWSGIFADDKAIVCHERLGLVGLDNGEQPIVSKDGRLILAVNGEIYNHQAMRDVLAAEGYQFQTQSDCEIIMALYAKHRSVDFVDQLEGMFGFVLWDLEAGVALIARDHMGIIPLYTAADEEGNLFFASEMKSFVGLEKLTTVAEFLPRHVQLIRHSDSTPPAVLAASTAAPTLYYTRAWEETSHVLENVASDDVATDRATTVATIRDSLTAAVKSHMMCDVPYGVLLSGGLDSSIISAITKQVAETRAGPALHSFAIGLVGAPDLKAAAEVAKHLGTVHHEMVFTIQEGLDAIRDVVYHIETYDVTTIRASTPMYLLARKIKAMGVKMVLSGEGADEVFGGYLYFHKAPGAEAHHDETVRKLKKLHQYDCLRANKAMAAWGVEARVPFLDKTFIDAAMHIDPAHKLIEQGISIEKQVLREAFEEDLPHSVAWRQKEQFGDGVGYSWIDGIKDHAEATVSDADFASAAALYPFNTPTTKEGFMYRKMFAEHFPDQDLQHSLFAHIVPEQGKSVACSTAEAMAWCPSFSAQAADPSGRTVTSVHGAKVTGVTAVKAMEG